MQHSCLWWDDNGVQPASCSSLFKMLATLLRRNLRTRQAHCRVICAARGRAPAVSSNAAAGGCTLLLCDRSFVAGNRLSALAWSTGLLICTLFIGGIQRGTVTECTCSHLNAQQNIRQTPAVPGSTACACAIPETGQLLGPGCFKVTSATQAQPAGVQGGRGRASTCPRRVTANHAGLPRST